MPRLQPHPGGEAVSSWHALPMIGVGAYTVNAAEIASIEPNRHQPNVWCTVSLDNGRAVDLPITADELRRRILTIEAESPISPGRADLQVQQLTEELRGTAARVRVLTDRVHRLEDHQGASAARSMVPAVTP